MIETGVKPFAEAIYRYGANEYHETYTKLEKHNLVTEHFGKEENTIHVHTG